jgi:hypothetical protein
VVLRGTGQGCRNRAHDDQPSCKNGMPQKYAGFYLNESSTNRNIPTTPIISKVTDMINMHSAPSRHAPIPIKAHNQSILLAMDKVSQSLTWSRKCLQSCPSCADFKNAFFARDFSAPQQTSKNLVGWVGCSQTRIPLSRGD